MILRRITHRETFTIPKTNRKYTSFTLSCGHVVTYENKRIHANRDVSFINCLDCAELLPYNQLKLPFTYGE